MARPLTQHKAKQSPLELQERQREQKRLAAKERKKALNRGYWRAAMDAETPEEREARLADRRANRNWCTRLASHNIEGDPFRSNRPPRCTEDHQHVQWIAETMLRGKWPSEDVCDPSEVCRHLVDYWRLDQVQDVDMVSGWIDRASELVEDVEGLASEKVTSLQLLRLHIITEDPGAGFSSKVDASRLIMWQQNEAQKAAKKLAEQEGTDEERAEKTRTKTINALAFPSAEFTAVLREALAKPGSRLLAALGIQDPQFATEPADEPTEQPLFAEEGDDADASDLPVQVFGTSN